MSRPTVPKGCGIFGTRLRARPPGSCKVVRCVNAFMQLAGTRAAAVSSVPDRELPGPAPRLSGGDLGVRRSTAVGCILGSGSRPDATRITAVGIAGDDRRDLLRLHRHLLQ